MNLSDINPFKKPKLNRAGRRAAEKEVLKYELSKRVAAWKRDDRARKAAHTLREERARQRTLMRKRSAEAGEKGVLAMPALGFFKKKS